VLQSVIVCSVQLYTTLAHVQDTLQAQGSLSAIVQADNIKLKDVIFQAVTAQAAISSVVIAQAAISLAVSVFAAILVAVILQDVILLPFIIVEFQTNNAIHVLLNNTRKSSFHSAGRVALAENTLGLANCQYTCLSVSKQLQSVILYSVPL
jgi:type IV secretory pathway VirB3-like protein